jgi:hypothetical protein
MASSSEQRSALQSASRDARSLRAVSETLAVAHASVRQPAEASVPSALPVGEAAEAVAEPWAQQRVAAEAAVPHAEVAAVPALLQVGVAAVPHAEGAAAAAERASLRAAVAAAGEPRVQEGAAVARPLVAPSACHPDRLRPEPARRRAARSRHAMERSPIAAPKARWWQAARGEVWSW